MATERLHKPIQESYNKMEARLAVVSEHAPGRRWEQRMESMTEKKINSGRGFVHYWTAGPSPEKASSREAQAVFFLPGLTANHHLFDFQTAHFASRFRVLVWDAPAHGKSRPCSGFSYSILAEELRAILAAEGIGHVVLIGQSAGGFVAQSFAAKYPDMVTGMLLIGTCPYGPAYYSGSDLFWLKQTKWMFRLFPDRILRHSMARMCSVSDTGRKNMLQMLTDYDKKELCRLMYLGLAGFIPEIRDTRLSCPVWLLVGAHDRTGKVRKYNDLWHQREGYPSFIIKNAAHNANVDQPEEVNRIIEGFLEGCMADGFPGSPSAPSPVS
mgnify:CR=1 FL=1